MRRNQIDLLAHDLVAEQCQDGARSGLGLLGALVGYGIFTGIFGIGDDDKFDWGGIVGAVIGAIIVVAVGSWAIKKFARTTT